ncbi:RICIN domain-containing protein [Streptomyces sp. TRM64462]|uniref:RICIN domain-containing protein n=1 Tax=Streptomyces sp. TRM64462 TaxID=2741726 RepID=UPI001585DA6B|nr:hypothetical protein [Streptomyces sp. TRM64462]
MALLTVAVSGAAHAAGDSTEPWKEPVDPWAKGIFKISLYQSPDYVWDVPNWSTSPGVQLIIWENKELAEKDRNQLFQLDGVSGMTNVYKIRSLDSGLCARDPDPSWADEGRVVQDLCGAAGTQYDAMWELKATVVSPYKRICNVSTGRCVKAGVAGLKTQVSSAADAWAFLNYGIRTS